jgi:hypothetical protein
VAVVAVAGCHSHNGFGVPVPGSRSTCNRITVPSMIGSGPSWPAQAPVGRGWCDTSSVAALASNTVATTSLHAHSTSQPETSMAEPAVITTVITTTTPVNT